MAFMVLETPLYTESYTSLSTNSTCLNLLCRLYCFFRMISHKLKKNKFWDIDSSCCTMGNDVESPSHPLQLSGVILYTAWVILLSRASCACSLCFLTALFSFKKYSPIGFTKWGDHGGNGHGIKPSERIMSCVSPAACGLVRYCTRNSSL